MIEPGFATGLAMLVALNPVAGVQEYETSPCVVFKGVELPIQMNGLPGDASVRLLTVTVVVVESKQPLASVATNV